MALIINPKLDFYKNIITLVTMKTATEFKLALQKARNEDLNGVREAVKEAIATVEAQMDKALENPTNVSHSPVFGDKMPAKAFYKGKYDNFLHALNTELALTGWRAEESHDGGGMYATYLVRMAPTRTRGGGISAT